MKASSQKGPAAAFEDKPLVEVPPARKTAATTMLVVRDTTIASMMMWPTVAMIWLAPLLRRVRAGRGEAMVVG